MLRIMVVAGLLFGATTAHAAECRSLGGHLNGVRAAAVRQIVVKAGKMTLSGTFNGQRSPRRTLPCRRMQVGFYCERAFDGALVTVMTRGERGIENVTDPATGAELAAMAYLCDRPIR